MMQEGPHGLATTRDRAERRFHAALKTWPMIPEKDLAEWDAAIEEYEAKHGRTG